MSNPFRIIALSVVLIFPLLVHSACECGYVIDNELYTDLMVTNFLHSATIPAEWKVQDYTVPQTESRGPYGKVALPENIVTNPLTRSGARDSDAGLQMIVRGGIPRDGLIPMAELATVRDDFLYGSFRAGMKHTGIPGTCSTIFWYRNNTQEIDLEFLSHQYGDTSHPVNLVLQSPKSVEAGFDAAATGSFIVQELPFAPHLGFHEYRFDWTQESVSFWADGAFLATIDQAVPIHSGSIIFSHWSNGNEVWSGGPPARDAVTTISYFKAYFNSSDPALHDAFTRRCKIARKPNAICTVH